jgi:hypothetical protein
MKTADEWAPEFAYFGNGSAKYSDSDIERIAISSARRDYCNLCDAPFSGTAAKHTAAHMRDLRAWRARRAREAAKKSKVGLATYQKERALANQMIEPIEED